MKPIEQMTEWEKFIAGVRFVATKADVVRWVFTIMLLVFVFLETGVVTAFVLGTVAVTIELLSITIKLHQIALDNNQRAIQEVLKAARRIEEDFLRMRKSVTGIPPMKGGPIQ